MDGWRCKTGRRASKKSRGGDCRWVVSTGMLMLRRKPCLFVGWMGKEARGAASGQVRTDINAHSIEGKEILEDKHLNKSGGLVQRHLSRGNVQPEPGRLLPLQAAGALPLWFSHVLCPTPGLPATWRHGEKVVVWFLLLWYRTHKMVLMVFAFAYLLRKHVRHFFKSMKDYG